MDFDFDVYYPDVYDFDYDYDMIYVTQFYPNKLWVLWYEVDTGKTLTSEFELNP